MEERGYIRRDPPSKKKKKILEGHSWENGIYSKMGYIEVGAIFFQFVHFDDGL